MSRDLEEFLRMAAERRKAAQQHQQRPQQQRPPQYHQPQYHQRPPQQQYRQPPPLIEPEVIEEVEILDDQYTPIEPRLQTHIDTSSIRQHAGSLGQEVSYTDERVSERLHRKFDHDVSHIDHASMTESPDAHRTPLADELLEMFQSPKSLRQAILIQEILRRPEF